MSKQLNLKNVILKSPALSRRIRADLISSSTDFLKVDEPINDAFDRILRKIESTVPDHVIEHIDDSIGVLTELGYMKEAQIAIETGAAQESK